MQFKKLHNQASVKKLIIYSLLLLLASCASAPKEIQQKYIDLADNLNGPSLSIPNNLLGNSKQLDITGLNHQSKRIITIGKIKTSIINVLENRAKSDSLVKNLFAKEPINGRKRVIEHSYSYYQSSPDKTRTNVSCVDLPDYESITTDFSSLNSFSFTNPFSCQINAEISNATWVLKMYNPDKADVGTLRSSLNTLIKIKGIKRESRENIGYEFLINEESVAVLSMVKNGQVILHNTLNAEQKTIILSAISALIIEYGLIL